MPSSRPQPAQTIRDVGVRQKVEAHLAQMEGRYRGLLEAAPDAMVVVNEVGEIVLLNLQAEKRFGYPRDELLGQKVTNIIPQGFAERLISDRTRTAAEALAQQIGTGIELTARRKDGSAFPVEIMLSPLENDEGTLVTAAIRDISVRKAAEEHLAQMEGRYRGLLEAAPDAMVVVDEDGEIVLLNLQAEKQFGYRRDELLGQKVTNIIPQGFAERLITDSTRTAAEALAQQIGTGIELTAVRKDGTAFPIELMLSPLEGADEILVTAAIRDISVRKAAEEHLAQMEGRYRGLLEAAPDAMVVVNEDGEIVLLNLQAEKQFGYRRDELLGQKVTNIIPQGFAERLITDSTRTAAEALAQQIGTGIELTARRKDGTAFPVEIMLSPLESAEEILVTAAIRDISVRKAAEEHLAQMEGRYRGLLEAAPDAMVVVNEAGEIVLVNLQAEKQFGYRRDELLGQKVTNIIPEGFAERLIADSTRTAAEALAQQIGTGIELTARCKNGTAFPVEIMLSPLESPDGILVTAAIRDISARKAAEADALTMTLQMAHSAEHDFLTGLPNRMLLNDRVGQAIVRAERHANKVAVLFLDVDGFKHINDSLGHPTGDKLLKSIAERLLGCVRAPDTVSRQGGDEFVVLLSEIEHDEDTAILARRMLKQVMRTHTINGQDLHITASIGVSVYPDDGTNAETLIKNADTAMYQAKEKGRQSYQFFKPAMNVRAVERQSIEEGLRRALERRELVVHYQPKVGLSDRRITGAEALIRWNHPTRGLVPPGQFIPVAEECGLIRPIGAWVLREACKQARAWADAGLPALTMAVNVSAMEFREDSFLDGVFETLDETGFDPRQLELELTESVLVKQAESAASILRAVRDKGVQVAIDDFGTGYSSLSYLRKFPVDALKIDQSFVRQISTGGDDTIIVTAIIALARSLKLRVVAEGVETVEELAFLSAHRCDEVQGYYFGRPVPPHQFASLLKAGIPERAFVAQRSAATAA